MRIDDRLLHAQVLQGWAPRLMPQRIVLAHDGTAADAGVARMYRELGEGDWDIDVVDVSTAAARFCDAAALEDTFLVMGAIGDARRMVEHGAQLHRVNLGGLHETEGRRRLTHCVFLTRQDVDDLRFLLDHGVQLEARDVPTAVSPQIDAAALAALWP